MMFVYLNGCRVAIANCARQHPFVLWAFGGSGQRVHLQEQGGVRPFIVDFCGLKVENCGSEQGANGAREEIIILKKKMCVVSGILFS